MKKLVATFALLCVSSTVLAHDIYSTLRDRDGHLCCGGQDCEPVEAVVLLDGNYYLPGTDEVIPTDVAAPSPDDRFHHCVWCLAMASILGKPGGPGQFPTRDLSTVRGALQGPVQVGGQHSPVHGRLALSADPGFRVR